MPEESGSILVLSPETTAGMDELAQILGRDREYAMRVVLDTLKKVYPKIVEGQELYLFDPKTDTERRVILPKP